MKDANKKVILRLREVGEQKGLTFQEIVDICEAQGEAISLSTVRRFFTKPIEDGSGFRTYTINAIFHAVIGTEDLELTAAEEADLTDPAKEAITENAALKAIVELRDATIEELNRQIEELNIEIAQLKETLNTTSIKMDATIDMFRIAMESLGKSVSH